MHEIASVPEFCPDPDVFFKFLLPVPHPHAIDLGGFGPTMSLTRERRKPLPRA